ncbi:hypothetical protein ACJGE4_20550 (plasmid) [Bacillus velezensis]|uniref:hypothetical protein n=1 Tax=Bacillus TaxID=1386 RepID=UPI0004A0A0E7|nr:MULTISPECIES: hypothetical protein [Bacillus amyloliquefaciens group]KDN91403.1 hypothetical protein EF87_18725 [Bacillus amyloliquefaciens]MED2914217.1 hypothetical protein [Bacillus velezensis]QWQ49741.1 hypothetical protein KOM03_20005 [Bacillus velezensis]QYC35282.1 hypothetical protein J5X95_20455 [Bacillus amyloliquefaciens]UFD97688.1 hypothetical protein [Bacillus amyloliquefaciens]
MVKDNAVVKVTATAKELNSMIHKRQARLPLGHQIAKGERVDVYCAQKSAFHQFVIKNFSIKNNHILVKFTG